jgi:hypothetical protein
MTITPVLLSGSTNGRQIKVVATATAGTAIHTAAPGAGGFDEVWLYAINTSTATVKLTIEFGGATSPDDLIEVNIPPESGPFCVVPGIRVNGTVAIAAFAGTANVINISGNVNRYAP